MAAKRYAFPVWLTVMAALSLMGALPAMAASNTGHVQIADGYTIFLKLLPVEHFTKASNAAKHPGEMVKSGGAKPVKASGPQHPNHHLVVFLRKNYKPVEDAQVKISYKKAKTSGSMKQLPVTRMWVAGKGRNTTHFGNNVDLAPGKYQVHVTVNGKASADFQLTVQ